MSTQQDIYAAGSESHPHMLNKENYVPWSSRLLWYAKSKPNGKLIHNSILNGPYVRRMIPKPGDANREVTLTETFHVQTDDELSDKELNCETAQEIWLRVQQMMKGSDIGNQEKKAKLFNQWERFTFNEGESTESYYHHFLKLMNDLKRNKHFPEKIANNLKFLNNLQPEWSRHVTIVHQTKDLHTADYTQLYDFLKYNQKEVDELKAKRLAKTQDPLALMANSNNPYAFLAPHQDQSSLNQNYLQQPMPNPEDIIDPTTAMNMALVLMAKAFKLNYSTPTNNNQRISGIPRNRQITQSGQNAGNLAGYNDVIGNQNQIGNDNLVAARAEGNAAGQNGNQIRCYNCRGVGIQLQAEEYDLMAAAADLKEIEKVNANCILMANLQQASTSGTQTDSAPVYDSDGSAENDNNVIFEDTSVEQGGETVEQHSASFEETRALYESLYQNLAIEVEKVNSVNRKLKETNADLPTELARFKNQTSVARKFLNGVKSTIVTLQCVVKHKITIETHNWSSSAHQKLHKIVKDEIFPIDNQVDARVQNFEIQSLKEAAKFVGDFKSLANEVDASLAKHKALELEIKRLLKAVIERLQAQLGDLKGKSKDTLCVSDTRNPLSQKLENENVELEFQVLNYARENAHLKATYKNLFDSISVSRTQTKTIVASLQNELQSIIYKNANLRTQLFKKVSDQKDNTQDTSAKKPIVENLPTVGESHALSIPVTSNSVSTPQESKVVKNDKVIAPRMFRINPEKTSREEKNVPNTIRASNRTKPITVSQPLVSTKKDVNSDLNACNKIKLDSQDVVSKVVCVMCKKCLISVNHDVCLRNYVNGKKSHGQKQKAKVSVKENQMKYQPKVTKPKKVGFLERLATPKPRKPRFLLRWSPTGRLFDQEGKIVDSDVSESQSDCSNGDNACNLKLLINFVWKFMGTVWFGNDHVAAILGFGDLQCGNILITRVYFVEGLGHNLFSIGQFCDSDLEVAFRRNACFVRNLERVNLLKGDRLPKFKYNKEHLCPSCEQGKSKRASHPPKPVPNSRQRLHLFHIDLCGPMRIASINGKRYVLVIVDDYSRYTWVHFLRSKDEAPEVIKTFLKRITVLFQSPVIIIRTDYDTEFKNQVLKEFFDSVGISHQLSSVRTPQQNRVVERQNRTLVEAARTMLIFSRAPLFLWAEVIATACFTQNCSIIHRQFNETPYELINGRKPDISFLHVFGALCYPKNDCEDLGSLVQKKIMETMNVSFDKLSAMAFEQRSSKPGLHSMTSGQISSGLDLTYAPSTITTQQPTKGKLDLLFEAMYDDYIGGQPSATARTVPPAQEPQVRQTSTASTTIADSTPTSTNLSSLATNILISSQDVDELNSNAMVDGNTFFNPFANSSTSAVVSSSSQNVDPSNMHTFYQPSLTNINGLRITLWNK
nr:hypothetical protein [Tanacetum cinerariifolium]